MPVAEFDFASLKAYVTSSKDYSLKNIAKKLGKRYMGSSSSMTSVLSHFHFLLSRFRSINLGMLSKAFPDMGLNQFTLLERSPSAIFLKWRDGSYAIDADKQFDSANVLSLLGKAMEKLLTLDTESYEKYRKSNSSRVSDAEREASETYHYSTMGDILMRSQLDAYDHRLPGTGVFDLKTRAVASIRMDTQNYQHGIGYEIKTLRGKWESYEREYYDMIRSAFLKYSLQVRMGRMDGIFVAFHNVQRLFGFQYISLPEMDLALHGHSDTTLGDKEFKLSLGLLNRVLDSVTEKYPETVSTCSMRHVPMLTSKSIRLHFEARDTRDTFMYIFAEPVTEDQAEKIQSTNAAKIREFERNILGLPEDETPQQRAPEVLHNDWAEIAAGVKEALRADEGSLTNLTLGKDRSLMSRMNGDCKNEKLGTSSDEMQAETSDAGYSDAQTQTSNDEHGDAQAQPAKDESSDAQATHFDDAHHPTAVDGQDLITETSQQEVEAAEPVEVDFDVTADSSYLDSINESTPATVPGKVSAWSLSVRHQVNGKYIHRPDALTHLDEWEVEYSLTEITNPQSAWDLYQACQLRRKKELEKDKKDLNKQSKYLMTLRKLSEAGVNWRRELDEAEKGKPKRILTLPKDAT